MVSIEETHFPSAHKQYDPVTFDVLRVNLDELAGQITLNDLQVFKRISVTELLSCAWTSKSKWEETPNIAEFTQNFNSISYLVSREVLAGHSAEHRSNLITYFIKLAKKLYYLNNLHSTWAIISALTTQPIFRLSHTWHKVSKSYWQQMQRLNDLFSSNDNFANLRSYMDSKLMPCIPHIGLYLTDLIFMHDMMKKSKNQADRQSIQENIDKLLRSVCSYQDSCYELTYLPHIQTFLADAILPLPMAQAAEKLFYQLSLRLEPDQKKDGNDEIKNGARRSSLPLQAIRSLTHSAAKFSPNTIGLKSPRRKKSLADILSPGLSTIGRFKTARSSLGDDQLGGVDNESYTSPTRSRWYTLENADEDEKDVDECSTFTQRSTNSSRLSDLAKRLKSLDIYEAASPAWRLNSDRLWSHFSTTKSASTTPKIKKRPTFTMTPELLRRSKTPTMNGSTIEQCSLIGDETCEDPEVVGIFTRTQLRGQNAKNKLIRPHQTCFVELRGRILCEYERKLVPLHVNEDRELFQQRAKRQINLNDGGWHVRRPSEPRPGFQLEHDGTGRAYQYTCRSWTTANHWLQLINDAIQGDNDAHWAENGAYANRYSNGIEATRL